MEGLYRMCITNSSRRMIRRQIRNRDQPASERVPSAYHAIYQLFTTGSGQSRVFLVVGFPVEHKMRSRCLLKTLRRPLRELRSLHLQMTVSAIALYWTQPPQ